MKIGEYKILILVLIILGCMAQRVSFGQKSKPVALSVNGIVKNIKPGDSILMIYLWKQLISEKKDVVIDSVVPDKNREFFMNRKLSEPGYYRIGYKGLKSASTALLLLDAGTHKAKIIIDTMIVRNEMVDSFIANKIYIRGIKDNDLLDSFFNKVAYYYKNYESPINKRMLELEKQGIRFSEIDSLNTLLKKIRLEKYSKLNSIVDSQMGVSIAIYQTMEQWDNSDFEFMDKIFAKFAKRKPLSFITAHIEMKVANLKSGNLVSKSAIPFILVNEKDQSVNIGNYIGKKIIFIDFWASWCMPCLAEMPSYKRIYEKYQSHDFIIVGVSADGNKDNWRKALLKQALPWLNVVDEKGKLNVAKKYGVSYMPSNYLIDKEGKIIRRNINPFELEEYLKANIN